MRLKAEYQLGHDEGWHGALDMLEGFLEDAADSPHSLEHPAFKEGIKHALYEIKNMRDSGAG